ncbi:hypothetical protein Tco_0971461 [Tanacetum coccineum]
MGRLHEIDVESVQYRISTGGGASSQISTSAPRMRQYAILHATRRWYNRLMESKGRLRRLFRPYERTRWEKQRVLMGLALYDGDMWARESDDVDGNLGWGHVL